MNELLFAGKNLSAFNAYLASSNFLDGSQREVESVSVAGRSGDLLMDRKRFKNFTLKAQMYITSDLQYSMGALRAYMNSFSGYQKYEETIDPQHYRLASFQSVFEPSVYDHVGGAVELIFNAKPQRYLRIGDKPISVGDGQTVTLLNPTRFGSSPLIDVTGTGTFIVGNVEFTLAANTGVVHVDFERQEAWEDGIISRNSDLTMSEIDFPTIPSGTSTISASGCSLKVYPRWFTI